MKIIRLITDIISGDDDTFANITKSTTLQFYDRFIQERVIDMK